MFKAVEILDELVGSLRCVCVRDCKVRTIEQRHNYTTPIFILLYLISRQLYHHSRYLA